MLAQPAPVRFSRHPTRPRAGRALALCMPRKPRRRKRTLLEKRPKLRARDGHGTTTECGSAFVTPARLAYFLACLALNACVAARAAQPAPVPAAELAVHAQPASPVAPPPATSPALVSATASAELSEPSLAGAEAAQPLLQPRSAHERGWLGVELAKRAAADPGVLVRDVVRGSPAANSGVLVGDVILSVDGENVTRPEDVSRLVAVRGAGQRLRLGLQHAQVTRLLAIDLERFPDSDEVLRRQYVGLQAPEFDALETARKAAVEPRLASPACAAGARVLGRRGAGLVICLARCSSVGMSASRYRASWLPVWPPRSWR